MAVGRRARRRALTGQNATGSSTKFQWTEVLAILASGSIPGKASHWKGNLNLQCNLLKDWRRSDYSVNQSTLTASHPACLEAL